MAKPPGELRWSEDVAVMKRRSMKQLQQSIEYSQAGDAGVGGSNLRDKIYWLLQKVSCDVTCKLVLKLTLVCSGRQG